MKNVFLPAFTCLAFMFLFSCGDDDATPSGSAIGTFTLSILDAGNEVILTGEAGYRGSSGFINNTTRHAIDLEPSDDNAGDVIINVLLDGTDGVWQADT